MRVTAGARFNASKRLADHDRRLNVAIAIVSCFIILVTVFQAAFDVSKPFDKALTIYSIVLSIFVLVLALIQFASSDAVHAEQHHRCALEIDECRRDLDLSMTNPHIDAIKLIVAEYGRVLANSNLNHNDDDMLLYVCSRPELGFNLGLWETIGVHCRSWLAAKIPYFAVSVLGMATIYLVLRAFQNLS